MNSINNAASTPDRKVSYISHPSAKQKTSSEWMPLYVQRVVADTRDMTNHQVLNVLLPSGISGNVENGVKTAHYAVENEGDVSILVLYVCWPEFITESDRLHNMILQNVNPHNNNDVVKFNFLVQSELNKELATKRDNINEPIKSVARIRLDLKVNPKAKTSMVFGKAKTTVWYFDFVAAVESEYVTRDTPIVIFED